MASTPVSVQKSEEEWRAILTPEQFHILREKGTEPKGTGHYDKFYEEGVYNCAGCGTPLYKSTTKFNSGCGWPAFFEGLPGTINRSVRTLMGGGQRLLVQLVVGTWGMSSKARVIRFQQTRGTALTACRSSSCLLLLLLHDVFHVLVVLGKAIRI
ncbi:UNVERIFIED_CONTAM: Peptide methionine sulfoxide reductase B5 [Sesamum latifolium]|uniref:Peptide methionine sulfoxide reductase B5 n=1 Tax=Sesamum latifolium TaxID=2727402 RepID=A0AAW2XXA5_9LAMI